MKGADAKPEFDDKLEEVKTIKGLTVKEIKAKARPEFEANPAKFYPTKVFEKMNFERHQCPVTKHYYWKHKDSKIQTCGDSSAEGKYSFIGKGVGIGRKGTKITYAQAWEGFKKSLTSARVPCKAIDRYPVVARWRNDVDYVAAGIYCFQPYCVTGELDPPANPLICPQFSVRFNDLDNIGLTGRHYSGFIMLGIQVFNYPDKYVFFKEECVEFFNDWLTKELEIDPTEITYVEDVWAGGGNLGPSVEAFVGGLEIGNMVFMQYKTFHDGSYEELDIKVIDVGIGLERIPWAVNGSATSYEDTFANVLKYLRSKLDVKVDENIWEKFGPYSCLLDVDESENIDKTWEFIAEKVGVSIEELKKAILMAKDLYIVADHTRTAMMIIQDGSLPSNNGGGSNLRNVIRRVFAILKNNDWWSKLGLKGFLEIFEHHKLDLEGLYGKFKDYPSFEKIIEVEYERWSNTDTDQKAKFERMLKKSKTLTDDDWIVAVTSYGIPADSVAKISGQPIPNDLYYKIAQLQERITKPPEVILYNVAHLKETELIFYEQAHSSAVVFEAKVLDVFANLTQKNLRNIVILDKSVFYPTSGGQQHDVGTLKIDGEEYNVVNVEKVGKVCLHILDRPLPNPDNSHYVGMPVVGKIDEERRKQLKNHHTGTHIVFAACRKVLGPHVWQNGAKKTIDQAHLDITHFDSLTKQQEVEIENAANRIILQNKQINKFYMDKAQAELEYGFRLYQGGVVPGNQLRVVNIEDTDVEACCGTHCDNTSEVGWIKILRTTKIQDGIVRLYYVAGERTITKLNAEKEVLNDLQKLLATTQDNLVDTADKFFKQAKHYSNECSRQEQKILRLQVKYVLDNPEIKSAYVISDEDEITLYVSFLKNHAVAIRDAGKGIVFIGKKFIYGILHNSINLNLEELKAILLQDNEKAQLKTKDSVSVTKPKAIKVDQVLELSYIGVLNVDKVKKYFNTAEVRECDL
eukprot:CAMPEP_0176475624 /NCGR_PEP_ID=MMETSP0127-20121128/43706_1 /TAXON_ID=938130 /ORGANISM="Platyophrya macrostoma, Strain WH" /LENGTH=971 /DNA_ID=CAMNT_0017871233 /DNA_START=95 /DNA_END=3010 /DNA_ORIENTATION=+